MDADDTEYRSRRGDPVVSKSGDPINDGPVVMHYHDCVASNLGPAETLPEMWGPMSGNILGIVVHFKNGLILDMRTEIQKTTPQPSIDYFVGETLSWSAVSLAWAGREAPASSRAMDRRRGELCHMSLDGVDKEDVEVKPPVPTLESH